MILRERDVEEQAAELLTRHGWYSLKTDAGNVRRGQGKAGDLPSGWPDMVFFLSLGDDLLCLAAIIEMKTVKGKVRPDQTALHGELRMLYRLPVQIVRDPEEVHAVIERGRQLRRLLGGGRW
ncbi:hypothetical protein EHF33_20615 (plasmid) [Deinococcus psychrotolerans]|uniref:VRR-NUC domain-containing protein n=1 Tax=Deinococcus psychrotolerans TaxID=2489213 RepID=A0A3G8YK93_9DEIO|nr:hypothetical protein [Deinococcus psychrotolerans]AZI45315.1 hypothetical protein EHF33_20615 [Deinococcus psychrotolerans]